MVRGQKSNSKAKKCISPDHVHDDWCYSQSQDRWYKCRSPYCELHGLKERERRARKWEHVLYPYKHHHWLSIHFGEITADSKRKKAISRFRQLVERLNIPCRISVVPHWQYGKKHRNILNLHWHICVSSDEVIPKKVLKSQLTKAATEHKCNKPSKIRLGYKLRDNCQSFLVYAFRIGKYKERLILPPAGIRREFARSPRKPRKTTLLKKICDTKHRYIKRSETFTDIALKQKEK